MRYDSAGTLYQLESAGMIEIYAEQDGRKINVAPGKEIDVELVSEMRIPAAERAQVPSFNVYQLDTEARNWVYHAKDAIEVVDEVEDSAATEAAEQAERKHQESLADLRQQELREIQGIEAEIPLPVAPVRPERATSDDVFDLDFNDLSASVEADPDRTPNELQAALAAEEQRLRELRQQYAGTLWQISPNSPDYQQQQRAADNINWEDMQLRRLNNRDFELTLISGDTQLKMIVNPVLSGEDYDRAIQEFNQQFEVYQQAVTAREAQLADARAR